MASPDVLSVNAFMNIFMCFIAVFFYSGSRACSLRFCLLLSTLGVSRYCALPGLSTDALSPPVDHDLPIQSPVPSPSLALLSSDIQTIASFAISFSVFFSALSLFARIYSGVMFFSFASASSIICPFLMWSSSMNFLSFQKFSGLLTYFDYLLAF